MSVSPCTKNYPYHSISSKVNNFSYWFYQHVHYILMIWCLDLKKFFIVIKTTWSLFKSCTSAVYWHQELLESGGWSRLAGGWSRLAFEMTSMSSLYFLDGTINWWVVASFGAHVSLGNWEYQPASWSTGRCSLWVNIIEALHVYQFKYLFGSDHLLLAQSEGSSNYVWTRKYYVSLFVPISHLWGIRLAIHRVTHRVRIARCQLLGAAH